MRRTKTMLTYREGREETMSCAALRIASKPPRTRGYSSMLSRIADRDRVTQGQCRSAVSRGYRVQISRTKHLDALKPTLLSRRVALLQYQRIDLRVLTQVPRQITWVLIRQRCAQVPFVRDNDRVRLRCVRYGACAYIRHEVAPLARRLKALERSVLANLTLTRFIIL